MGELLSLIAAAAGVMILMLAAILLVRRRMQRGELVQATVHRVDLEDPDACGAVSVTLTYTFLWQGQTLEIRQRPRRGILPPREGERQEMRWDAASRRLRELPSGRSLVMPILIYAFVFSALTVAAGFAVAFVQSMAVTWIFPVFALEAAGFLAVVLWITRRKNRTFQKQVESGILQPVRAEFQGCVRRTDDDGSFNVPVYQCLWNGQTFRLEIGRGRRPYRLGDMVTLYRDRRDGSVVEAPRSAARRARPSERGVHA